MRVQQQRGDCCKVGTRRDFRLQDTLPSCAGSEPSGLCTIAALNVPGCIAPGSCPASQVFLNQRQTCVSSLFVCLSGVACFVMFYVISAPSLVSAICCGKEFSTAVCLLKGKNTDQLDTVLFPSALEDD